MLGNSARGTQRVKFHVCFYHFGFALGPIESQLLKMKEPGESIIDLLELINQDMNSGTQFQNRSATGLHFW